MLRVGAIHGVVVRHVVEINVGVDDVPHRQSRGFNNRPYVEQALFDLVREGVWDLAVGATRPLARHKKVVLREQPG